MKLKKAHRQYKWDASAQELRISQTKKNKTHMANGKTIMLCFAV